MSAPLLLLIAHVGLLNEGWDPDLVSFFLWQANLTDLTDFVINVYPLAFVDIKHSGLHISVWSDRFADHGNKNESCYKGLICNTCHQVVSRCSTTGDSEECVTRRWQESMQARYPPWFSIPGQMSREVQNRGITGTTKRISVLRSFFHKIIVLQWHLFTFGRSPVYQR